MATATSNLVHDNSSLANFKAWAQFISNAFSTFGWTQTADTGQVNWSTIASVPSSNTVYEVWKMGDPLQSTCPVFLKVNYGYSSTSVEFWFQIGQGSDGAGNLTGAKSSQVTNNYRSNLGISTFPCYASGDSGSFRLMMWQSGSTNLCFLVGVERSKDSSGNNIGNYVTFFSADANYNNQQGWAFQQLVPGNPNASPNWVSVTSGNTSNWSYAGMPFVFALNTLNFNGSVCALPIIPLVGQPGNPMLDWVGGWAADASEGTTNNTISIYGANHNYAFTAYSNLNCNGKGIFMRYE